ncbi:thioredoxin family protein [Caloranaerobacter sp. DY30410]|uniref:thioredoxin family protein n=1 Tax=Caloranaerobacter sp. DY30410 TaxID=3238305 RepID=UPI003D05B246
MDVSCLYDKGVSFDEFVNKDKDTYREKALEILDKMKLNDDLINKVKSIDKKIKVLVCAEIWCPDCMINVPVLAKMKQLNDNIDISIVEKNGNEDFFIKYSEEDRVKIPTFVFFDENFKELGSFVEHPKKIKDIISKGNQPNIIVAMRKYRKGEYAEETLKDILEILLRSQ